MSPPPGFSSLTFLSCSHSVEWFRGASLAKFGYILDTKAKKEIESFLIFGYLLELITNFWQFEVFLLLNLENFSKKNSMKNAMYRLKSYFPS
jgi:hypothetical protein